MWAELRAVGKSGSLLEGAQRHVDAHTVLRLAVLHQDWRLVRARYDTAGTGFGVLIYAMVLLGAADLYQSAVAWGLVLAINRALRPPLVSGSINP